MVGVEITYTVVITNFCDHDITTDEEKERLDKNIRSMADSIGDTLASEHLIHPLDSIDVTLETYEYIDKNDIALDLTII